VSQTVHAQQEAMTREHLWATQGARLFAAYWLCLAAVDLTRAAPGPVRLGVVVVVVAACSLHQGAGTAGAIGVVGWLFVDGFVSHALGVLAVDGAADVVPLLLLVAVALVAARAPRRRRHRGAR
jgi:hypothetical protein